MSYREQLRQAREILQGEIQELQMSLASKEMDLRKLDGLLKDAGGRKGRGPSLTSQIVEVLHALTKDSPEGVSARAVVQEFGQARDDVNESTIRSTLYQVTRKMRPTEIAVDDEVQQVRVIKNGPLYDVELVSKQEAELI